MKLSVEECAKVAKFLACDVELLQGLYCLDEEDGEALRSDADLMLDCLKHAAELKCCIVVSWTGDFDTRGEWEAYLNEAAPLLEYAATAPLAVIRIVCKLPEAQ